MINDVHCCLDDKKITYANAVKLRPQILLYEIFFQSVFLRKIREKYTTKRFLKIESEHDFPFYGYVWRCVKYEYSKDRVRLARWETGYLQLGRTEPNFFQFKLVSTRPARFDTDCYNVSKIAGDCYFAKM